MAGVALICLGVLLYTYVGYPLVIGLLARFYPTRVEADDGYEPTVSVCIAAYNAALTLEAKLSSIVAQDYPRAKVEILVYSDGSTDETETIARTWAARDERVRLIVGEGRRGKPTGLNRMAEEARGEVLLITDSRQPLAPQAMRALVSQLGDPSVGCATGNLILAGRQGPGVYWRYENWIRRQEARFRSMVGMTGPIAALRKIDLDRLPQDVILDDVWIPMHLRLAGYKVAFAEQAIAFDRSFDDAREFGRKVRTLAGNYQIFALMPELLSPLSNPSWFETVSHKVLRLVCPWVLVTLLVASAAAAVGEPAVTESPAAALMRIVLAGQILFYGIAVLGARAGRVGAVARTFVVLNVAALVGLWRFLTSQQKITW